MLIESAFWALVVKILAIIGGLLVAIIITIAILMRLGWDVTIDIYKK